MVAMFFWTLNFFRIHEIKHKKLYLVLQIGPPQIHSYQSGPMFGHEPVFSSDAIFPDVFLDSDFFLVFYDLF